MSSRLVRMARNLNAARLESCVERVRHFNRFYTRKIGVLREGLLDSSLSLTEARVLYELARRDNATATEIGNELDLDTRNLSRILRGFQKLGWIRRTTTRGDARLQLISLNRLRATDFKPFKM